MSYICKKPKGSCQSCPHYRFDSDRERMACFVQVDKKENKGEKHMYRFAMKFSVDVKDKTLSDALNIFEVPDKDIVLKNAAEFTYKAEISYIPTKEQIKDMEQIFIGQELNGLIICGCRFVGYAYLEEFEK